MRTTIGCFFNTILFFCIIFSPMTCAQLDDLSGDMFEALEKTEEPAEKVDIDLPGPEKPLKEVQVPPSKKEASKKQPVVKALLPVPASKPATAVKPAPVPVPTTATPAPVTTAPAPALTPKKVAPTPPAVTSSAPKAPLSVPSVAPPTAPSPEPKVPAKIVAPIVQKVITQPTAEKVPDKPTVPAAAGTPKDVPAVVAPVVSVKAPVTATPPPPPAPKEAPKDIEKDAPTAPEAVPSELKGIDTLDIDEPGGNWLVKRMWWEKAEEKMEKIEAEVDKIMKSRMAFFEKRDKVDSQLFDPFYLEVGLDQGQLEEIATYLISELKKMREKRDSLTREERAFLQKLQDEKQVLKQTKADVEAIRKLDDSLDDFITKLVEQINVASRYRKEARETFKKIGKILDHNKARELFHKIEALWQSVKGVGKYISGDFSQSFEKVAANARTQTERIKAAMDKLEKKGLGFKKQFELLKNKADIQKEKEEKEKLRAELKKQMEEQELEEGYGMFARILNAVASPLVSAWQWISSFWKTQEQPDEISQEALPDKEMTKEPSEPPALEKNKEANDVSKG